VRNEADRVGAAGVQTPCAMMVLIPLLQAPYRGVV
jgi:hypothetical protein